MKTFPNTPIIAISPGPPITFLIPLSKPLAISLPAPSPSITSLIPIMSPFKGSITALAIGSNVDFPIFSWSLLNSSPVWVANADKVLFNWAVAKSASLVAAVDTFNAAAKVGCDLFKSLKIADRILAWKTPATCSRKYALLLSFKPL